MSGLSEQERKAYENYLLAESDEQKQAAIKQLIPGSQRYYHLYFLDVFNKKGGNLSEEEQGILDQFAKKHKDDLLLAEIHMRLRFLKYDLADKEEEKAKIIEELRDRVLYMSFSFNQPEEMGERDSSSKKSSTLGQQRLQSRDFSDSEPEEEESYPEDEELNDESLIEEEQNQCFDQEVEDEMDQIYEQNIEMEAMRNIVNMNNLNDDDLDNMIMPRQMRMASQQEEGKQNDKHSFNQKAHFNKQKILKKMKMAEESVTLTLKFLDELPIGLEETIDFTKLHLDGVYQHACYKMISDLVNPTFYEALQKYLEKKQKEKNFGLNQQLCNRLTLAQMDKLAQLWPPAKEDQHYIGAYFEKQFYEELSEEHQEQLNIREKRENLQTLYKYSKSRDMPRSLQSTLLLDILEFGIQIGEYDEKLFKDYLAMPMVEQPKIFKKEKKACADTHWNQYLRNVQSNEQRSGNFASSQQSLINRYLEHFCYQDPSLAAFKEDFDPAFLEQIQLKVSIYQSDDMTNLKVDARQYQLVQQEVIIRFLESNSELFRVQDSVQLKVELKNVQTLYVKIFEFNTETYYKKTLAPFNTGVNLDGLVAAEESKYEYAHAPNKKFVETFIFDSLKNKVGLYIVEFIGNGMSARAIIKKGSLSLIHKPGVAGHIAYILDENKEICKTEETGVYFQGEYFKADLAKNGQIFIPYGKQNANSKAILMNKGFAQLCDFERQTEKYSFKAFIHVNPESILIGNKTQVMIRPCLTVNDRKTNVELLKNTTVNLTTINYIDRIPMTKTYNNQSFKNDQELLLDFQVPPYLEEITVLIETELFNVTQNKTEKFSAIEKFPVKTFKSSLVMCDLYLRKENLDYYLYVLGKNGEAKPNIPLSCQLGSTKYMNLSYIPVRMVTDKDGKVKLGHLKDVKQLEVSSNKYSINSKFFIHNDKQLLTYPTKQDTIEGENIEFPVLFDKLKRANVCLLKVSKSLVLEDMYDRIEFEKREGSLYNLIHLKGLEAGEYQLRIKREFRSIKIVIHKGQFWEGDQFILKNNCLFQNSLEAKMVKIENVKVEEGKDSKSEVIINLKDFNEKTRVHCYAQQFIGSKNEQLYYGIRKILTEAVSKTLFPFAMWKNIFISNRELGDEFRYVFDRKFAARVVGSTLDRPKIVLRRNLIGGTTINQEVLKGPTDGRQQERIQMQSIQRNFQPMSQNVMSGPQLEYQQFSRKQNGGNNRVEDEAIFGSIQYEDMVQDYYDNFTLIKEFQNFLMNQPYSVHNLKPDQNGQVKFSADLSAYTQLSVFVIDENSNATTTVPVTAGPIQKRNLCLTAPLDQEQGFTESRNILSLMKGEKHSVEDITSTEIQIVDDLQKVQSVIEELKKQRGDEEGQLFKDLKLLIKWLSLSDEEKNDQYSRYSCHELNIFIYFKDQPYFNKVVKSHLKNKMDKTFVDNYLLGNYAQVLPFYDVTLLQRLNALEQCLLIDALTKNNRKEDAQNLCNFMNQYQQKEKANIANQNKIFDIVLNMNNLKKEQQPLSDEGGSSLIPGLVVTDEKQTSSPRNSSLLQLAAEQMNARMLRPPARKASELCYNDNFDSCSEEDDASMDRYEQKRNQERKPMPRMAKKNNRAKPQLFDEDFGSQRLKAGQRKMNFEEIEETKEYCEMQYLKQNQFSESAYRIKLNAFYTDFANYLVENGGFNLENPKPFVSPNFIHCSSSSFVILTLLSLPLESASHEMKTNQGRGMEITPSGNLVLFKKEVKQTTLNLKNDIMITHRYLQGNLSQNAFDENGNQINREQDLSEFLTNTAYKCEVIMTNVSPIRQEFSILYQIPKGSLPLQNTKYMKSITQVLAPYTTDKVLFYFYFPEEGDFSHFPTNIAINQEVVARPNFFAFKAVKKFTLLKKETFKDIMVGGSKADVLDFLKNSNLVKGEKGFTFGSMCWMLKDKEFFNQVIIILRSRLLYDPTVWSHSLYHKGDEQTVREYLTREKNRQIFSRVGTFFNSKLVSVDPEIQEFQHLDYFPMLNARVHSVGDAIQPWSLNLNFKQTYERFLKTMVERKELTVSDKLVFVYYMNLQDRVEDSLTLFNSIKPEQLPKDNVLKIQHDYMTAYFDFFTGGASNFSKARQIVREYLEYPVVSWRLMFLQMLDQLNEYDGEIEEGDLDESQLEEQKKNVVKKQAKKEPQLQVEVKEVEQVQAIVVESLFVSEVVVKFYIIDVEILFSRTPFLKEQTEEFTYVKPCHVLTQPLTSLAQEQTTQLVSQIGIPEGLKEQNMVVEINGGGKQLFRTYYSSQLKVQIVESYGEVKVMDLKGKPIPKVYIKVFAQNKGQSTANAVFFKDGYTDIRGKFEYCQLSGQRVAKVEKFAVLIMSDTHGSMIRECKPPVVDVKVEQQEEASISHAKYGRIMQRSKQVETKMKKKCA